MERQQCKTSTWHLNRMNEQSNNYNGNNSCLLYLYPLSGGNGVVGEVMVVKAIGGNCCGGDGRRCDTNILDPYVILVKKSRFLRAVQLVYNTFRMALML